MKLRTTLILFAAVVAIGIYIKFYESKRPNTEEANRRAQNVVNFDREKIDGIAIQNGEDRIELTRSNQKWRLEAPVKDLADSSVVDNLLFDLDGWQKESTISAKEIESDKSKLAEFGLAKAKSRLKLAGKDAPPEIWFGNNAALENKVYVRLENSKEVYLASKNIRDEVTKKPEDFRDRKLTDIVSTQVNKATIKSGAGELELQKIADHWEIMKPMRARADDQRVNDLIAQLTNSRIQQFVADDRGDLHPYGLSEARGSVTLFTGDDKAGQSLQIGGPVEKDQVYVRFAPRSFVYTLPRKVEEILNYKPNDLRDKHLVRFDQNQLDRITIEGRGKNQTVLARKGENWTIANKQDAPANSEEVRRLLSRLENEKVTGFVQEVASDLTKFGLNEPQLTVTLSSFASENTAETNAGDHPLATIAFGRVEGDNVSARVGEEPYVVVVRRNLLNDISPDPTSWQPLTVYKFQPAQVHQIGINGDQMVVRTNEKEWKFADGKSEVNQSNVQSLINTLAKLRAVRWISTTVPATAFEKPVVTLTFTTSADDKAVHKLIIGGPTDDGMWFARTDERDGTFAVSAPDFTALRLPLAADAGTPASSVAPTPVSSMAPSPH